MFRLVENRCFGITKRIAISTSVKECYVTHGKPPAKLFQLVEMCKGEANPIRLVPRKPCLRSTHNLKSLEFKATCLLTCNVVRHTRLQRSFEHALDLKGALRSQAQGGVFLQACLTVTLGPFIESMHVKHQSSKYPDLLEGTNKTTPKTTTLIPPPIPPRNPSRAPYAPPVLVTGTPKPDPAERNKSDKTIPRSILVLTWHTGPPKKVRFPDADGSDTTKILLPPTFPSKRPRSFKVSTVVCKTDHLSSRRQISKDDRRLTQNLFHESIPTIDEEPHHELPFSLDLPTLNPGVRIVSSADRCGGDNSPTGTKNRLPMREFKHINQTSKLSKGGLKARVKKIFQKVKLRHPDQQLSN